MLAKINTRKFLDVRNFINQFKKVNKFVIIGPNQCGKTYSATDLMIENLVKKNEHGCWIRNTEIESTKIQNSFIEALDRYGVGENYIVNKHGAWTIVQTKTGAFKPDKLCISFVYLNSLSSSVPQNLNATLIVLDEFIDGNEKRRFTMKNYAQNLQKAVARLIGKATNKNIKVIGLANPHRLESDLLTGWGIDFDWDKLANGEISEYYNKQTKTYGICLPVQFNIKEMKIAHDLVKSLDVVNQSGNIYKFPPAKFKNIFPNVEFKCEFIIHDMSYLAFGKTTDGHYYVKECEKQDYNVPIYCLSSFALDQGEIYVKDVEEVTNLLEPFLEALVGGKVWYHSEYSKTAAKEVKYALDELIELNEI